MILDLTDWRPLDRLAGDVVVLGAGTVGLFVAQLLARRGLQVVVLEAGGRYAEMRADGFGAATRGKPHAGTTRGRAFGLGGTSVYWGGQLAELQPVDVCADDGWPLGWDVLEALYARCYSELKLPRRASDASYAAEFAAPLDETELTRFFTCWLPDPNFATLYAESFRKGADVRVLLGATAVEAVMNGEHCTAVRATGPDGARVTVAARAVVLAMGTIANVQFCFAQQQRGVPWAQNEHIGARFQDHLGALLGEVKLDPAARSRFRQAFENGRSRDGHKLQPKLRLAVAARTGRRGMSAFFRYRSMHASDLADLKQAVRAVLNGSAHAPWSRVPLAAWRVSRSLMPLVARYLKERRVLALFDQGIDLMLQAEQRPTMSSRIRCVASEVAPDGLPAVAVDWRIDGAEVADIRGFVACAERYFERNRLGRFVPSAAMSGPDENLADSLFDTFHQAGGLCMGSDPSAAATDAHGRIWGTANMFVAGASVLPSSGYANTTLTALALAIRTADQIGSELRR